MAEYDQIYETRPRSRKDSSSEKQYELPLQNMYCYVEGQVSNLTINLDNEYAVPEDRETAGRAGFKKNLDNLLAIKEANAFKNEEKLQKSAAKLMECHIAKANEKRMKYLKIGALGFQVVAIVVCLAIVGTCVSNLSEAKVDISRISIDIHTLRRADRSFQESLRFLNSNLLPRVKKIEDAFEAICKFLPSCNCSSCLSDMVKTICH